MEKKPRGLCLIINNENFYDENGVEIATHKRYGTNMDASRLKNLFEKLHFVVEMCVDMSEKDMRIKISQFAKEAQFNSHLYDAFQIIEKLQSQITLLKENEINLLKKNEELKSFINKFEKYELLCLPKKRVNRNIIFWFKILLI